MFYDFIIITNSDEWRKTDGTSKIVVVYIIAHNLVKGKPVFVFRAQKLHITLMFYNAVIMHRDCENCQTMSLDRRV